VHDGTEKGGALSIEVHNSRYEQPIGTVLDVPSFWFAVQTRTRHEKKVNSELREKGIDSFLPLHREKRRWSDRSQWVELPLFPQYLFVRVATFDDSRIRVLQTAGVIQFVGEHRRGTPIPDEQIESLREIFAKCIPTARHDFLHIGERVRICSGALTGVEGILVAIKGDRRLVISVEVIRKSVAIQLNGLEVERV
jgi:transcription termination/antitermination protein NusG